MHTHHTQHLEKNKNIERDQDISIKLEVGEIPGEISLTMGRKTQIQKI